ncbi:hypothetical protein [Paenibacillus sp. GCM10012303]|uniref:hypothetical protein n=1 Tax=Paenibacillus sp. GCM10012303 TaxID=3317340 RepID=UPI003611609D
MYNEEQAADHREAAVSLSPASDSDQPGIDYSVDFIYGSDQSQYVEQQHVDEDGPTVSD